MGNFWYISAIYLQDSDDIDNDQDDDDPHPADAEGRIEKYIGVKVKACYYFLWLSNILF